MVSVEHSQGTRDNVTDTARSILIDCVWENTVSDVLKYDAPHPRMKEIPDFSDWIHVMKATGGAVGIGWYNTEKTAFVEFTMLNAATDSNNPLEKVITDMSRVTGPGGTPEYKASGYQDIHDNLDAEDITPICVSTTEIQRSLPLAEQRHFPLKLSPQRELNMFDYDYSDGINWNTITEYTPVTDPAREVIERVPWTEPRDEFLSYATTPDPQSFLPNANEWMKIMKETAGQIITAWYDPDYNTIDQITYYELRENHEFRYFTTTTDLADKTSIHEFNETLTESRLIPTAMSIHGRNIDEFK